LVLEAALIAKPLFCPIRGGEDLPNSNSVPEQFLDKSLKLKEK
jgi:hypothetical protein